MTSKSARRRCPQCEIEYHSAPLMRVPERPEFEGLFLCGKCSLVSLQPYPGAAEVASWYAESGNWELLAPHESTISLHRRQRWIEQLNGHRPGRMFEIGAGRGDFLSAMVEQGWAVHGLEPARRDVQTALERHGLALEHGIFTESSQGTADYDVVASWDVLEHCRNPAAVIEAMLSHVRPGGVLVLAIPHVDGLPATLLRTRWRYRMSPIHLHFFPIRWFEQQAQAFGAEVVDVRGFAKVHAWAQALLPERVRGRLIEQMNVHSHFQGIGTKSGDEATKQRFQLSATTRRLIRHAILQINQTEATLPLADIIEVAIRRNC